MWLTWEVHSSFLLSLHQGVQDLTGDFSRFLSCDRDSTQHTEELLAVLVYCSVRRQSVLTLSNPLDSRFGEPSMWSTGELKPIPLGAQYLKEYFTGTLKAREFVTGRSVFPWKQLYLEFIVLA